MGEFVHRHTRKEVRHWDSPGGQLKKWGREPVDRRASASIRKGREHERKTGKLKEGSSCQLQDACDRKDETAGRAQSDR